MAIHLDTLPEELILRIMSHLHRLDDLYSAMLTSKKFARISNDIAPHHISRMALATGDFLPGLQPHQHILLIPTARRLADWAVHNDHRRKRLASSMLDGIDGLVALAMREAPISLDEIRKVWRWKQEVLNPLSHDVDEACGRPTEPDGFLTVCETPSLMLLIWVIYGELFHHSFSYLFSHEDPSHPTPLESVTRFKFLVYCMPDVNAFSYMDLAEPEWFAAFKNSVEGFQQLSLNHAIREYLTPSLWGGVLNQHLRGLLGSGVGDSNWRFENLLTKDRLFLSCVASAGTKSLDLLVAAGRKSSHDIDIPDELVVWLRGLHAQTQALPVAKTQSGDISSGRPYDPLLQDTWFTLPWDMMHTLWDSGNYSLRDEVVEFLGEDEAWSTLNRAIGEDPLVEKTSFSKLMDDIDE